MIEKRINYAKVWISRNFRVFYPLSLIFGCLIWDLGLPLSYVIIGGFIVTFLLSDSRILICTGLLCLGIIRTQTFFEMDDRHVVVYLGQEVELSGTVAEYPYVKGSNQVVVIRPRSIMSNNSSQKIDKGLVQAKFSRFIDIKKDSDITIKANLAEPEVFEDFDYKEYLKTENIYALAEEPQILELKYDASFYSLFINSIRSYVVAEIGNNFPEPHAKLLAGMIIGTREEFSQSFAQALSISGTAHVIAVSGYNIALIVSAIIALSGWINRRILLYLTYLFIFIFIGIVGFDNLPALRAGLMGFITITSLILGRKSQALFVLFLVAGIMSMQNPLVYKSISFQLSFAATLGLMLLSDRISSFVGKILPKTLSEEAGTTLTAIIVTFPITFANFGTFGIYSLLANILIAPLVPVISLSGIAWLVIHNYSELLAMILKGIIWGSIESMIRVINWTAQLPNSQIEFDNNTTIISLIVLVFLAILFFENGFRSYMNKNV